VLFSRATVLIRNELYASRGMGVVVMRKPGVARAVPAATTETTTSVAIASFRPKLMLLRPSVGLNCYIIPPH
jgi:hypothetical protein